MDATIIASLANLGAAGAVIAVVLIFLKYNKERDAEWRDFFTELNENNCRDGEKRLVLTEKIMELVKQDTEVSREILEELRRHDQETVRRIDAAVKATTDAVANGKGKAKAD